MKKDVFTKPVVKIPVIVVLTTIISIFVSSLGDWDPSQDGFIWKIVFLALSVIAYIAAMIFFATEEINQRRALGIYKSQVNTFENLMIGIISICGTNASDINKFFVGIPVFCDNRKMVGLLEVVGFDDDRLGCLTREEMEEKVNKYLVPYANMLLLVHKMEKALFAGTAYSV